jgi:hypothetical protein
MVRSERSLVRRKTAIELAGEDVMKHLMELVKTTDLSYRQMATRVNDLYKLNLSKNDVYYFFRSNTKALNDMIQEKRGLGLLRVQLSLDHNTITVKDIKLIDNQIDKVLSEEMISTLDRAKTIADLLEKKGNILIRHARLTGSIREDRSTNIDKMQVNIYNQIDEEKSDIISRMKVVSFKKSEPVIDVKKIDSCD